MILYFFYLHKKLDVGRSVSIRQRTYKIVVVNISFNTQAHSAGEFFLFSKNALERTSAKNQKKFHIATDIFPIEYEPVLCLYASGLKE